MADYRGRSASDQLSQSYPLACPTRDQNALLVKENVGITLSETLASFSIRVLTLKNGRVGNRMVNVSDAELRAETQLTRRYWGFLERLSKALSMLRKATDEAKALAVSLTQIGEYEL